MIETSGHRVSIGGNIDAGQGGTWLVDPDNLTVDAAAANTINDSLNSGTNVTLQTTKTGTAGPGITSTGSGNIKIDAPLTWSSAAVLTLDAYHSVEVDEPISISGAGGLDIVTSDGSHGGSYSFDHKGWVDFGATDNGGTLSINGTNYVLVYTMTQLQELNSSLKGDFALAASLDASTTKHWKPIGTNGADQVLNNGNGFTGSFEGLGNSVSNLDVQLGSNNDAGLFGVSSGSIRDLDVLSETVVGGNDVGAIVGDNHGQLNNIYARVSVSGKDDSIGGVAGFSDGTIINAESRGSIIGSVGFGEGGIAGANQGQISRSHSSANVSGDGGGGLVGINYDEITKSYSSGQVRGQEETGGLVGENDGDVSESFATGKINGDDYAGGLIGDNAANIENCYATGTVTAKGFLGGLAGSNSGSISFSYSVGRVIGSGAGGLVGDGTGDVKDSYWDKQTSHQSQSAGGIGLSTAKLQSALPKGFDPSIWAISPDVNDGFPYLIALASAY